MWWLKLNAKNRIVINKWDKFWRLTFIEEIRVWNRRTGRCVCECWKIVEARLFNLKGWNTNSCWCYGNEKKIEANTTHWLSKNRLFSVYNWILQRCNNQNSKNYDTYWWAWIKCEWQTFQDFLNDMESSYVEWLTVDRINWNWNYCKDNCRWATMKQQNRNRKSNIMVWDICLMDYCTKNNLKYVTITHRINSLWWSVQDAITIPIKQKKKWNVEIISRNNFIDRVEIIDWIEVHTYYNPEYENYSITN